MSFTFHDIDNILNAKSKFEFIGWCVAFALAVLGFVLTTRNIIVNYVENPRLTKVSSAEYGKVPSVTFCPASFIDWSQMDQAFDEK